MKKTQSITVFDFAKPVEINAIGTRYFKKGWFQNRRFFFDYELIFLLDGEIVFIEEDEEIRVRAGEVVLLSPHLINSSHPLNGTAQTIYLHFQTNTAPRIMNRDTWHRTIKNALSDPKAGPAEKPAFLRSPIGLCRWMRPAGEWARIVPLLEAAIQEKESFSTFGKISASLYVTQVLLFLSRSLLEGGPVPPLAGENPPSYRLIQKAEEIILYRYSEGLNVMDLADSLNVTPQHLIRTFQDHCSTTPLARIHQIRLAKAGELLKQTTLSIKEISTMVGMPNVNHFCRFFRKQTGASARQWRVNSV